MLILLSFKPKKGKANKNWRELILSMRFYLMEKEE